MSSIFPKYKVVPTYERPKTTPSSGSRAEDMRRNPRFVSGHKLVECSGFDRATQAFLSSDESEKTDNFRVKKHIFDRTAETYDQQAAAAGFKKAKAAITGSGKYAPLSKDQMTSIEKKAKRDYETRHQGQPKEGTNQERKVQIELPKETRPERAASDQVHLIQVSNSDETGSMSTSENVDIPPVILPHDDGPASPPTTGAYYDALKGLKDEHLRAHYHKYCGKLRESIEQTEHYDEMLLLGRSAAGVIIGKDPLPMPTLSHVETPYNAVWIEKIAAMTMLLTERSSSNPSLQG